METLRVRENSVGRKTMKRTFLSWFLAAALVAAGSWGAAAPAQPLLSVDVGGTGLIVDAPYYIGIEKGYFAQQGLAVRIREFPTANAMTPLLVKGELPIIGGGIGVAIFNAFLQGLPLKLIADRAQYPIYHDLLLRPDLKDKIKSVRDLKGKSVALATGSIVLYEMGKVLETAGLTIRDVDAKNIAFGDLAVAFQNKVIDAAIAVEPFITLNIAKKTAVGWLDPGEIIKPPVQIGVVMTNSDWAATNQDVLNRFMIAWIQGAREYTRAERGGPNRSEITDILVKHSRVKDRALYAKMKWVNMSPNGELFVDSIRDVQSWYKANGYLDREVPVERMVDLSYARRAVERLGPFRP